MTGQPILEVKGLSIDYATLDGPVRALRDVSFSVSKGEALALVGESGSGKSTVALATLGLLGREASIGSGCIMFAGRDLTAMPAGELAGLRGNRLSMVFQDPFGTLNPGMRVGLQVAEPLRHHKGIARDAALERVAAAFAEVGLPRPGELLSAYPHQLSGGMQQRVLIAAALICEPELIILDEPTTALDVTIEAQILDVLMDLRRRRDLAMLFITHNLGVVNRVCDRVCVLYAGQILEQGRKERTLAEPRHPYTQGLLGAIPRIGPDRPGRLAPIPGHLPSPGAMPTGCVFHPRCAHALERCRQEPQRLRPMDDGLVRCWRAEDIARAPAETSAPDLDQSERRMEPLLDLLDLRKTYALGRRIRLGGPGLIGVERREVNALNGVSLRVSAGEVVGLVGESGSGKSTLGRCIVKLVEASEGRICFDGKDVTHADGAKLQRFRSNVQIIFQNPASSLNPRRSVAETIGRSLDLLGETSKADRQVRIEELLRSVGLPAHFTQRYPHQLSGGERQRVSIARALAGDPRFIVCDEPVSALDVSVQATVLNLLSDLRERLQLSYLFISHDLSAVAYIADRIAVMYGGVIFEEGPTDAVLSRPNHPYTEALLSAVPTVDPDSARAERIALRDSPAGVPGASVGCRFQARCPRKMGRICEVEPPPLRRPRDNHWIRCHLPLDELGKPAAERRQAREPA
jgi:peptide/nickel transport system ATP-binding protein